MLEPVLDRHSVESDVRAYTDARTERSMVVHPFVSSHLSVSVISSLAVSSFLSVSPRVPGSRNWLAGGLAGE